MTTEQLLEPALRDALRRRRPGPAPASLRERVGRVPDEVAPELPRPVRLLRGVLPAIAALAAVVVLYMIASDRLPAVDGPGRPGSGVDLDLRHPGGLADVGLFGLPWVPLLLGLGIAIVAEAIWRLAHGMPTREVARPLRRAEASGSCGRSSSSTPAFSPSAGVIPGRSARARPSGRARA
jgi:hypothetical protein